MLISEILSPGTTAAPEPAIEEKFPPLGRQIKVLMIWPRVPPSFWSQQELTQFISEKAIIPPLGLLTVAALCPRDWTIRLIDQNVEDVHDDDILAADLIMVSGMRAQTQAMWEVLKRARALGKRTMVGGPYASSEPQILLPLADHVVVGEPDAKFGRIACDLETGTAQRLYIIQEKPDVSCTPVPRFDLVKMDSYMAMAVQFSRGCPFQCEFCDIITIYGRKPRTKSNSQMLAEFDALFRLGWRKQVFIVDDNFIGNHKLALGLARDMQGWSKAHEYPFAFFTEASLDLAQRPELLEAMVEGNFFAVFIGIESPSKESLRETKKYQNLRSDPLEAVHLIQESGLWVMGGFIIGFDSDTEDIFERQREFIERAAIPWAMLGFLEAVPNTPLYDRMSKEGRLIRDKWRSNLDPPNFRTLLPQSVLVSGVRDTLQYLYSAPTFYDRALRSLIQWRPHKSQRPPAVPVMEVIVTLLRCIWCQGIASNYRKAWWRFVIQLMRRWAFEPMKLWWGAAVLMSGHHFIQYAAGIVQDLTAELRDEEIESSEEGVEVA